MSDGVAGILKEVLVIEMRGRGVALVAETANLSYDDVYAQTHERVNPSVHVIRAAYLVALAHCPEAAPRLRRLLEPEGWNLTPKDESINPQKDTESEIVDAIMAASAVIEVFREAKGAGRISKAIGDRLLALIAALERECAEAKAAIEEDVLCGGRKLTPVQVGG